MKKITTYRCTASCNYRQLADLLNISPIEEAVGKSYDELGCGVKSTLFSYTYNSPLIEEEILICRKGDEVFFSGYTELKHEETNPYTIIKFSNGAEVVGVKYVPSENGFKQGEYTLIISANNGQSLAIPSDYEPLLCEGYEKKIKLWK